jgi:hypothetical protein
MVQKDIQMNRTDLLEYYQRRYSYYDFMGEKYAIEGADMRQDRRRVPNVLERLVLIGVSLGLLALAVFVGSLYFTSSALPVRIALLTILSLFSAMIVAVNILFNSRH